MNNAPMQLKKLAPWKLIPLDTGDEQSILKAAESLKDVPIDLLINNTGILEDKNLMTTTKEDDAPV